MSMRRVLTGMCVCTLLWSGAALSATLDPALTRVMQQTKPDSLLPVLIRPHGALNGTALKRDVTAQFKTRAARHLAAVSRLREAASATQPAVVDALMAPQYDGRVHDVRRFWIDNAITAQMTPTAIAEIANEPSVAEVAYLPPIEFLSASLPQQPIAASTAVTGSATPGLRAIKADSLWKLGYTGKGRLVASIDTGVDGMHPFLTDKWRGHNGYPVTESWFCPQTNDTVPRYFAGEPGPDERGTNVMGIMVAIQDSAVGGDLTLDTVGVAFDAQWITAAVIDLVGANILEAMQWMADPDGDPNTELDVPDVVNNSWGAWNYYSDCSDIFWNAIDNVEAAGAVMLFAAGNEGNVGAETIRNPANRATTELNAFSIGMVDANDPTFPIHPLSSRGPSDCDHTSIKPELVAPGVGIQTTKPRGYMNQSVLGSSFTVPHVSGGVALLREYNPNATVDQIKTALIAGATDLGPVGPDNTYGDGMLNLVGALAAMPPNDQPALYIKHDYYLHPAPGSSTEMVVVLRSQGTAVSGVRVDAYSEDPRLTVVDGASDLGDFLVMGDTAGNFADPFVFDVDSSALPGERLALRFEISGSGGYAKTIHGVVTVGPDQDLELFTHTAGNFTLTVSALGTFGLEPQSISPRYGGQGYSFGGDPTQSIYEGAFLVGVDADHVSDNARDRFSFPDVDFLGDAGGNLDLMIGHARYLEQTRAAFSDANAEHPIGLFIEQRTYVENDAAAADYCTVEYTIHNRSGNGIADLYAGLFFDWDFPWLSAGRDTGGYESDVGVGWMHENNGTRYRGIAVLTPEGASSYRYFLADPELYMFDGSNSQWDGFTEAEKWAALSGGFAQVSSPSPQDGAHLIASGPFTLEPDDSATVAFAIIGATSLANLRAAATTARARYQLVCSCDHQGDINDDSAIDVMDVTALVDVLFYNAHDPADPLCSVTRSDLNVDGQPDALDLSALIDFVYFGGPPPVDPCL